MDKFANLVCHITHVEYIIHIFLPVAFKNLIREFLFTGMHFIYTSFQKFATNEAKKMYKD